VGVDAYFVFLSVSVFLYTIDLVCTVHFCVLLLGFVNTYHEFRFPHLKSFPWVNTKYHDFSRQKRQDTKHYYLDVSQGVR